VGAWRPGVRPGRLWLYATAEVATVGDERRSTQAVAPTAATGGDYGGDYGQTPGEGRLPVRDIILGMSDGLTVPFALAAGVSGAVHSSLIVIIAGFAELAAGAISMGLGGYLAASSEIDSYRRELAREHHEVKTVPDEERREVRDILAAYGLGGTTLERAVDDLTANAETWVRFMMREELGLNEPHPHHGWRSGAVIGLSYAVGGLVPLMPLGIFGWFKGRLTGLKASASALQTMLVGGLAAGVAYVLASLISGHV
jgi:VIT1/CCC1 family predicted Fe2+/Mn2+ transporter